MSQSIAFVIIFFSANFLSILGDVRPSQDLITALIKALEKGVTINAAGTAIDVGLVTVPFNALCKIPITGPEFCRVCMLDCIYSHKATSGKCGPHPTRPGETTCLCDYKPVTPLPSVTSVCKKSYSNNIFNSQQINEKFDVGVIAVLKIRLATVLCGAVLQGCKTDCIQNHAAKTGACKGGYCLCSH